MMKKISVSDLRHRVALERPELTTDSGGGADITWIKVVDLWASIEPLSGLERFLDHQTQSVLTHKIIIRFREDVLPEMRLRKGARVFEILSVMNEQERNHWLALDCKEACL